VLARWLSAGCRILLLDEPTRGIDVGAKAEIHALIEGLSEAGVAVVLVSSELPELIRLSHRILVLREGRVAGELSRAQASEERLLELMSGVGRGGADAAVTSTSPSA
jgi:ABC-type sugar transport system ATPase subunit